MTDNNLKRRCRYGSRNRFPRFDDSPSKWMGRELTARPHEWIHDLTAAELVDLDCIALVFGDRQDDLMALTERGADVGH